MKLEFRGIDATIENIQRIGHQLSRLDKPMRTATLLVTRSARRNAPVDTGVLRASIMPGSRSQGDVTVGVVGSNVKYAPFMELGTRPHWPPLEALETWARRHGTTAYVVARAISRRGLKPRRYLQRALEDNARRIKRLLGSHVGKIVSK
jgi:phage gpG-like protein